MKSLVEAIKTFVYTHAAGFTALWMSLTALGSVILGIGGRSLYQDPSNASAGDGGMTIVGLLLLLCGFCSQVIVTRGLDWRRLHATSLGCRLLSPECMVLHRLAKNVNGTRDLR